MAVISILANSTAITLILPALALVYLASWIYTYYRLSHIPGPWYAAWSDLPRMYWVWTGNSHLKQLELHRKYGPLVRLGPDAVSVSESSEIPNIYTFTGKFKKSNFYSVLGPYHRGQAIPMLFTTQDENMHRRLRQPIASIYSMTNLVGFEPFVDSTIRFFFEQIDTRFVATNNVCDLSTWLQAFAFDVMGEITVSKRLGFLSEDKNVSGLMNVLWNHFQYAAVVGQIPWLDKVMKKNPVIGYFRTTQPNAIVAYTFQQMMQRKKLLEEKGVSSIMATAETAANPDLDRRDFMSRFFEAKMKDPKVPEMASAAWSISNIGAGSDTTAITLRTILYYLLKNPSTMQALLDEIRTAKVAGKLSDPVTWHEARELPYLDACIKEAGRVHPAFGLPLERVVPPEGANICGKNLPPGTVVGVQMWAAHRNEAIFGGDVDEWRPERWLVDEPKRWAMEKALLTFGAGNRSCIGKNIALLEIYKLIPSLLQRYKLELARDEWIVESSWFVHQRDFLVRFSKREKFME